MKRDAYVINVARGGVIDEAALAEALARRHHRRRRRGRLLERAARARQPAAHGAQRHPDAAPRRLHGGGPDPGRRGGLRAGARRAGRPTGALRGQRPAHDAGDGRCAVALPAAGAHAGPVLRPVRGEPERPHPGGRRRAGGARLGAPRGGGPGRHPRDAHRGARQRRQRAGPGQGSRHQPGRPQDPGGGPLLVAADAARGPLGGRHRGLRRVAPGGPRRLRGRPGALGAHARLPTRGPPRRHRPRGPERSARPTSTSAPCTWAAPTSAPSPS